MVVALADYGQLGGGLAAGVFLHIDLSASAHFGAEVCRKGVDAAYADAVEAAGNLVGAFVELTAGVEHCQHHFQGALVFLLVHVDGDAAAVVDDGYGVILVDGYLDMGAEAGKGLVDRVVDHLVNQVVETFGADVADIHRRALAHGLKSFKHLDVAGAVFLLFLIVVV